MPSRLALPRRPRYFGPPARVKQLDQVQVEAIQGPWGGYCPDLHPDLAKLTDAANCSNIIDRGGDLAQPDGFGQVDNSHLPLGTPSAEPVVGIHQHIAQDATVDRFAITGEATLGQLYELVAGSWTNRAYDTGSPPSAGITGSASTLVSSAYHSLSNTFAFTNDDDVVYMYPRTGAGTEYTDFNDAQAYGVAGYNFGSGTTFKARSIETHDGRFLFINTVEASTECPVRVRWTNISATPTVDETATGAGFMDIDDVGGIGLRLLQIGNSVAAYYDTGVVILRKEPLTTAPYRKEVISQARGLIGTHAVVNLGSGIHFGLFNDGWFFLHDTGRWIEAGVRNIQGTTYHKFKDTFFSQLDWDNRDRVVAGFDHINRQVHISFPDQANSSGNPNQTWIYDIDRDTVWPQQYDDLAPNIYGYYDDTLADVIWSDFDVTPPIDPDDTWDSATTTWEMYGGRTARSRLIHGTVGGYVFRHRPTDTARDGVVPSYNWSSHESSFRTPTLYKTSDRLDIGYMRLPGSPPQITTGLVSGTQSSLVTLAQTNGSADDRQTDFTNPRLTGQRFSINLSGTGPVRFSELLFHYFIQGTQTL